MDFECSEWESGEGWRKVEQKEEPKPNRTVRLRFAIIIIMPFSLGHRLILIIFHISQNIRV